MTNEELKLAAKAAGANQAPMKPCDGLTPDALRKWGEALDAEMPRSIGEALIQFADAWASDRSLRRTQ